MVFDSYDMSPILFGTGKSARATCFYFTENELTPGAARVGNYKAVFNLRGDNGVAMGGSRGRFQSGLELTLSSYERVQWIREQLQKDGVKIPLPTGN